MGFLTLRARQEFDWVVMALARWLFLNGSAVARTRAKRHFETGFHREHLAWKGSSGSSFNFTKRRFLKP